MVGGDWGHAGLLEQRGRRRVCKPGGCEFGGGLSGFGSSFRGDLREFPKDVAMQESLAFCRGMRILRQPSWEAVATFITSSMKPVAHIAKISHTLRSRYGRKLSLGGKTVYAYPTPAAMAALEEADLRACSWYGAKTLWGRRGRWPPGRWIWKKWPGWGMATHRKRCVNCLGWERKWRTVRCYLGSSDFGRFRWMCG